MKKIHSKEEDFLQLPEASDESEGSDVESNVSNLDEEEISDSDSEPECFSFATTQEKRQKDQKHTLQAIKLQKEELKKKRKEIELQNLKQKEEKRRKIESKRLPDHVLQDLDDEFESEKPESTTEEPETNEKDDDDDSEKEITETAGNVTFKCKVLPVEAKKPKYITKKVANFKEQMLYGGRIKREKCNRDAVLKREKQRIRR